MPAVSFCAAGDLAAGFAAGLATLAADALAPLISPHDDFRFPPLSPPADAAAAPDGAGAGAGADREDFFAGAGAFSEVGAFAADDTFAAGNVFAVDDDAVSADDDAFLADNDAFAADDDAFSADDDAFSADDAFSGGAAGAFALAFASAVESFSLAGDLPPLADSCFHGRPGALAGVGLGFRPEPVSLLVEPFVLDPFGRSPASSEAFRLDPLRTDASSGSACAGCTGCPPGCVTARLYGPRERGCPGGNSSRKRPESRATHSSYRDSHPT